MYSKSNFNFYLPNSTLAACLGIVKCKPKTLYHFICQYFSLHLLKIDLKTKKKNQNSIITPKK